MKSIPLESTRRTNIQTFLLLLCVLIAGCGDGTATLGSTEPFLPLNPEPEPVSPRIAVEHNLTNTASRAVPETISSFRFTGFDSGGATVLGPLTRPTEERIVLDASTEVTLFSIEYLRGSEVVGYFETSVVLEPGQTYTISDPDYIDATAPLTGIEISGAPESLFIGRTVLISVRAHFADGSTADVSRLVTYDSSLPNVVSVDSQGAVTAGGVGTAEIEARLFTRIDVAEVTGALDPSTQVVSIEVLPAVESVFVGYQTQFQALATFGDGGSGDLSQSVIWESSSPTVASVDQNGLVTGLSESQAPVEVRATYTPDGLVGTAQLSVNPLNGPNLTLESGSHTFDTDTGQLDGTVASGWDGTRLSLGVLEIPADASLELVGSQPFEVYANFVQIAGLIDADGSAGSGLLGGEGGPGGFAGGEADSESNGSLGKNGMGPGGGRTGAVTNTSSRYTGGGAGHLENGRDGGNSGTTNTGDGGKAYDISRTGGSGGGGGGRVFINSSSYRRGGGGGGGGGVIILDATDTLQVTGRLFARGGNGAASGANGGAGDGGAGSGGRIFLRGQLDILEATINLNGGSNPGSGTKGHGSPGRLITEEI